MAPKPEPAVATQSSIVTSGCVPQLSAGLAAAFLEAWEKSEAHRYGFTQEDYVAVLSEVGSKCLSADCADAERIHFCRSLRHGELALARACAAGLDRAWDEFLTRYREKLYNAARSIAKDDTTGRELADSLYADLFGTTVRDGTRISKLNCYTGRGSLEGWLRTVLAQEFVNRYRTTKRNVSFEEKTENGLQVAAPVSVPNRADTTLVDVAVDGSLAALSSEKRLLLSAYYLDGRTLAEIGRMLGVHESTISRKIEKAVSELRCDIVKRLVNSGMDRRQASEAMDDVDVRDLAIDVRQRLAQDSPTKSFLNKETQRS